MCKPHIRAANVRSPVVAAKHGRHFRPSHWRCLSLGASHFVSEKGVFSEGCASVFIVLVEPIKELFNDALLFRGIHASLDRAVIKKGCCRNAETLAQRPHLPNVEPALAECSARAYRSRFQRQRPDYRSQSGCVASSRATPSSPRAGAMSVSTRN